MADLDQLRLQEILDLQDRDTSWEQYKVDWPEARVRKFSIEHFEIPRDDEWRIKFIADEGVQRDTGWGKFTKLMESRPEMSKVQDRRVVWMSDTRAEITEHEPMLSRLRTASPGTRVLINGLGLGVVARAVLLNPNVEHVDVVEINLDVATLVGQFMTDPRLKIHVEDAYELKWMPGTRWDLVWHDIWPTIDDANLVGMERLKRKYKPYTRWQGYWQIDGCRRMADVFRRMKDNTLPLEEALELLEGRGWL
jgi:hypothetical protein